MSRLLQRRSAPRRMTPYARTILANANLVGYWRLNNGGADIANVPHDAAVNGGVTFGGTGLITGYPNDHCATFDGTTGHLRLDAAGETFFHNYERTQAWTLEFLCKPNLPRSGNAGHVIFSKLDSSSPFSGFEVQLEYISGSSKAVVSVFIINTFGSNYIQVIGATDIANGTTWHVAVQYTGNSSETGLTILVNGVSETKTTLANSLSASIVNSIRPCIGARNATAQFYKGDLQEVAFYNAV